MAFHLNVSPRWQVGVLRFAGEVTGGEVVRAVDAMHHHRDWQPGFLRMVDMAGVAVLDMSPEWLEKLILHEHAERERIGNGNKAVLMPARLIDIAVVFKHAVERRGHLYALEVFTDEEQAWRWLCGDCVDDPALTRDLIARAPEFRAT